MSIAETAADLEALLVSVSAEMQETAETFVGHPHGLTERQALRFVYELIDRRLFDHYANAHNLIDDALARAKASLP